MIEVDQISVKMQSIDLLKDVSLKFAGGKMNLIIGPNGAGKSTLIKVLGRQVIPTRGQVKLDGISIESYTEMKLARVRAVLSQSIEVTFPLKVWEVVMMGRYPHFVGKPGSADHEAIENSMGLFGIHDLAERNFLTLSGGEKQRVHFARVLSQIWHPIPGQKRYLFLDEPLTFLDIHYQFQFMRSLVSLLANDDLVLVGVVHDLNLAARFADNLVLLSHGSVLAMGRRETVLTSENILNAFGVQATVHELKEENSFFLTFK